MYPGKCDEILRKTYLHLRSTILHERYGIPIESLCSRSRTVSLRGVNLSSPEKKTSEDSYINIQFMLDHVKDHFLKN